MIDIDLKNKLTELKKAVNEFEDEYGGPGYKNQKSDFKTDYNTIASALVKLAPVSVYQLFDSMGIDKSLFSQTIIIVTEEIGDKEVIKGKNGCSIIATLHFLENQDHNKTLRDNFETEKHKELFLAIEELVDDTLKKIEQFEAKYPKDV
ncbi:hypothetical protein [Sphingobacterium sp. BIGb0165]|uniref:hypothetical protein n=1 Tax=Sphingobacterium sp. BIGb0165 TaxID=2940615 RepID=UPI0021690BA0|nr:hypothetical protein [Sphingobacterium sp. BIGb0165]MCS4225847.1 hypothetical protein [Sphingobacterium sp. BIGb0165]